MIDTSIFTIADSVIAVVVAAVFLAFYIYERRMNEALWWSGAFVCLAISFTTISGRESGTDLIAELIGWISLFGFGAGMTIGTAITYEKPVPIGRLGGLAALQIAGVAACIAFSANASVWEFANHFPVVLTLILAAVGVKNGGGRTMGDFIVWIGLSGFALVLAGRGLWFSYAFSAPEMASRFEFFTSSLEVMIVSIIAMVVLAIILIASVTLRAIDRFHTQSSIDRLSGLLSRSEFEDRAEEVITQANTKGLTVCLIMADLDHFKTINDQFGHQVGDAVIAEFGHLTRELCAETNYLAGRIGGEEFAIAIPNCTARMARIFCEQLRAAFAATPFDELDGAAATASFGIAELAENEQLRAGLSRADRALYAAKETGRNKVSVDPIVATVSGSETRTLPSARRG